MLSRVSQLKKGSGTTKRVLPIASMKKDSRSLFIFDAVVDWHERHEFLKCKRGTHPCYSMLTIAIDS